MTQTNLKATDIKEIYPSVARTATPAVAEFFVADPDLRGVMIIVDKTATAATPAVVPTLEIAYRVEGEWIILKQFAAITDMTPVGKYLYFWYPEPLTDLGLDDIDEILAFPLVPHFRFSMVHGDADSITYSAEIHGLR